MKIISNEFDSIQNINEAKEFTFESLGIGRKIYLFINWFYSLGMTLGGIYFAMTNKSHSALINSAVALAFIIIFSGYAFWLHYAIVRRNLLQLLIISILNIIPFLNPIAAIIVFAIRSTSKSEYNK
jgi:hypothetical protein